jgi:hypothetical protein
MLDEESSLMASMTKPKPLCHICTPVGMLGYGFDEEQMRENLQQMISTGVPTAIILDSGSTDSGPSKLALGTKTCPDESYKKDLTKLIGAVLDFHIPLLVSSVGGSGSNEHVSDFIGFVKEIVQNLKKYVDLPCQRMTCSLLQHPTPQNPGCLF